jgi:NCS1 family nucleobase:cation symporter-1
MLAIAISTLATNIAANIVSPANDFSNLSPSKIDFKKGGYITGVIGVLIFPWKLIADPQGYIFTWLIAYSSLLGPVGGILIADYYIVRKQLLNVESLYRAKSEYWFKNGWNLNALAALVIGILPNLPGFLAEIKVIDKDGAFSSVIGLYHYAWFIGFFVSGGVYVALTKLTAGTRIESRFESQPS